MQLAPQTRWMHTVSFRLRIFSCFILSNIRRNPIGDVLFATEYRALSNTDHHSKRRIEVIRALPCCRSSSSDIRATSPGTAQTAWQVAPNDSRTARLLRSPNPPPAGVPVGRVRSVPQRRRVHRARLRITGDAPPPAPPAGSASPLRPRSRAARGAAAAPSHAAAAAAAAVLQQDRRVGARRWALRPQGPPCFDRCFFDRCFLTSDLTSN
jgi:hypothetical protein